MFHISLTLSNFRESCFDTKLSEEEFTKLLNKKWIRYQNGKTISLISTKDIYMVELEEFDENNE